MICGATEPAVGSLDFYNYQYFPVLTSQCVRDDQKTFARHCHIKDKIPSGNAYYREDILNLSKLRKVATQQVLGNIVLGGDNPMYYNPRFSGPHILRLKMESPCSQNAAG